MKNKGYHIYEVGLFEDNDKVKTKFIVTIQTMKKIKCKK